MNFFLNCCFLRFSKFQSHRIQQVPVWAGVLSWEALANPCRSIRPQTVPSARQTPGSCWWGIACDRPGRGGEIAGRYCVCLFHGAWSSVGCWRMLQPAPFWSHTPWSHLKCHKAPVQIISTLAPSGYKRAGGVRFSNWKLEQNQPPDGAKRQQLTPNQNLAPSPAPNLDRQPWGHPVTFQLCLWACRAEVVGPIQGPYDLGARWESLASMGTFQGLRKL